MENIEIKVLRSAKDLFLRQGYKKTTIRQIEEDSGVLIGSIYYFFKNKEDIFRSLLIDVFDYSDNYASAFFLEGDSPVYRYAVTCAFELVAVDVNERIAELYFEAYSSNVILDSLARHAAFRSQKIFASYNPSYTYRDYFRQTLAIKGVMRNFIANSMFGHDIPVEEKIESVTEISLRAFHVPDREVESIKKRLSGSIDKIRAAIDDLVAQKEMIFESIKE